MSLFPNFSSITLKSNSSIVAVFTIEKNKVYVRLEFYDENGKLLGKTRRTKWKY